MDLAPGRDNACLVSAQIVGAVRRAGNQPVSLEAVGEPLGDGNEGRGQEHRADDVWAAGGGLARPGNDASACQERDERDRDVDQEDRASAPAEEIRARHGGPRIPA